MWRHPQDCPGQSAGLNTPALWMWLPKTPEIWWVENARVEGGAWLLYLTRLPREAASQRVTGCRQRGSRSPATHGHFRPATHTFPVFRTALLLFTDEAAFPRWRRHFLCTINERLPNTTQTNAMSASTFPVGHATIQAWIYSHALSFHSLLSMVSCQFLYFIWLHLSVFWSMLVSNGSISVNVLLLCFQQLPPSLSAASVYWCDPFYRYIHFHSTKRELPFSDTWN